MDPGRRDSSVMSRRGTTQSSHLFGDGSTHAGSGTHSAYVTCSINIANKEAVCPCKERSNVNAKPNAKAQSFSNAIPRVCICLAKVLPFLYQWTPVWFVSPRVAMTRKRKYEEMLLSSCRSLRRNLLSGTKCQEVLYLGNDIYTSATLDGGCVLSMSVARVLKHDFLL